MECLPVYILAGGRSSRFGSDKARAEFVGVPLIVHVQRLLDPVASRMTVVADVAGKYADLNLRTIADHAPGRGPLAGLHAALSDLGNQEPWLLLCSCDAVVLEGVWLRALLQVVDGAVDAIAFQAAAPAEANDASAARWEPMPAVYGRSLLPAVQQLLATGQAGLQQLLRRISTGAVPRPTNWPEDWQVNTREDLDHLERASNRPRSSDINFARSYGCTSGNEGSLAAGSSAGRIDSK